MTIVMSKPGSVKNTPVPTATAESRKPSSEIIRVLNLLRKRIAKVPDARNEAEFRRLMDDPMSGVASRREVEAVLDAPFEFQGIEAGLFEIFRTECFDAGSLDSDALAVMQLVDDAIYRARQAAWGIRPPSEQLAARLEDLRRRENAIAVREADDILRPAIAEVQACAAGRPERPRSPGHIVRSEFVIEGDGPVAVDCRSFRIGNEVLSLTTGQAAVVKVFWDAWNRGATEYSEAAALEEAGLKGMRVRDLFKTKDKGKSVIDTAYRKLFKKGTKRGMLSLNVQA